jgi:predicted dehydrogenase
MSDRVRVGVIGAGGIATLRHLPAYKQCEQAGRAELVAVCDPIVASAESAAETFGVPTVLSDYRDLLAIRNLDAVSICTPNVHHEPISLAVIEAGKHVLCEKPLAMSLAGARRMHEAACAAGVKTAVNFRYRWIPAAGFVHDIIHGGELGEIYQVFVNYFNGSLHDPATPLRWRQTRADSGTGALGDLASHLIDLCRYWIGEFDATLGHFRTFVPERPLVGGGTGTVDVDDAVSFVARFANGAEGVFNASRCAIGRNNHQRAEIYGTKGAVIYEIEKWDEGGDRVHLCIGSGQARHNGFAQVRVPPQYLTNTPMRTMFDFVDAIRFDRAASPDFLDGLRCQEVMEAVEISAREHAWVTLPLPPGAGV